MNTNNKLKFSIYFLFVFLFGYGFSNASEIIPKPQHYQPNGRDFLLREDVKIIYEGDTKDLAEYLAETLSPATGWDLEIATSKKGKSSKVIFLGIQPDGKSKEGYKLSVNEDQVRIIGNGKAGLFNGIQTLRQMLPADIYNSRRQKDVEWRIEGAEVEDSPEYPWRGVMLDVSRYFYEKDYVLHLLDMMAMYKMNVLHLHLIDDSGWRLEIKKYPKLTEIGGFRGEGHKRTGGYYTQEEIKEIVAYASLRNIEVIPEVEVPAHTLSAIAAYPFLSCTEEPQKVQVQHSISRELYCVGKESTFNFLEDVFQEVAELFPSQYVHIGGDEANYDRWEKCPHCQKRKADLGLEDEKSLQVYFTNRVQKMLKSHGKTIVGWDEIIEEGIEDKAVGMVWHDKEKAIKGTANGHDVVMALTGHAYFDVAESSLPGEVKAATWLPPISLEKVYGMNPMVEGLDNEFRSQVLGAHATLWSDQFIHGTILQEIAPINENRSEKYFDYLTFPRLAALAEVCWTDPQQKEWSDFENRMETHYNRLDEAGIGYRVPLPQLVSKEENNGKTLVELKNVVEGAEIRYTTDGILPHVRSKVYEGPVEVDRLSDFMAITVVNKHQFSLPLYFPEKYDQFKAYGQLLGEWKPAAIKGGDYSYLEMDGSGKIDGNGTYEITFLYTDGKYKLEIAGVQVLKNGNKLVEDIHDGQTGSSSSNNSYKININEYETGAGFTVKAEVRGDLGNDSYGVVFIRKL
ncbi:hypothetical protein GCM10028791_27140 [Echinicola sediminis]